MNLKEEEAIIWENPGEMPSVNLVGFIPVSEMRDQVGCSHFDYRLSLYSNVIADANQCQHHGLCRTSDITAKQLYSEQGRRCYFSRPVSKMLEIIRFCTTRKTQFSPVSAPSWCSEASMSSLPCLDETFRRKKWKCCDGACLRFPRF